MMRVSAVWRQLYEAKQIIIFGTGYIAERFIQILVEHGIEERIAGFLTSDGTVGAYRGLPLNRVRPSQIESETLVCIAVHESYLREVEAYLQHIGVDSALWIVPYLYAMLLGEPIAENVTVPICTIMSANAFSYKPAVITLAIESYYGRCEQGKEWYMRLQARYSSKASGRARYQHLCALIQSVEKSGYQTGHPSSLLEDYSIIDGTHRICVAAYFGYEDVVCDIYPQTKQIHEIDSEDALMTKDSLQRAGLSTEAWNTIAREHEKLLQGAYKKE